MSFTKEEWDDYFNPSGIAFQVTMRMVTQLYEKKGLDFDRAVDDLLDGLVPKPWSEEFRWILQPDTLRIRRMERLVAKIERLLCQAEEIFKDKQ